MTTAQDSRLLDLLCPDKDSLEVAYFVRKIRDLKLNDSEAELVCSAMETEDSGLKRIVSASVWSEDKNALKVLINAYGFCGVILSHRFSAMPSIVDRTKELESVYQSIAFRKSNATNLSESALDRVVSQLKAAHLTSALRLDASPNVITAFDVTEFVTLPLVKNEAIIEKALPVILDMWQVSRKGGWVDTLYVDDVIDIAELVDELPDSVDMILEVARVRGAFSAAVTRDAIANKSMALSTGAL